MTDESRLIDPMKQVRELYPNASALSYERDETTHDVIHSEVVKATLNKPVDVLAEFLTHVRGASQNDAETAIINESLARLAETEG